MGENRQLMYDGKLDVQLLILNEQLKEYGLPSYATMGSAGVDLYACIESAVLLEPNERMLISTGVAIGMNNPNVVGLIFARSGWASKRGISLANGVGVIDSDYTDEVKVSIINHSNTIQKIEPGDRIAQLVFMPIFQANWIIVDQLEETNRKGGFGSTGK